MAWYVARCECRVCPDGASHIGVFPEEADPDTLECPRCHHPTSEAVEYFPPDREGGVLTKDGLSRLLSTVSEGLTEYRFKD